MMKLLMIDDSERIRASLPTLLVGIARHPCGRFAGPQAGASQNIEVQP